MSTITQFAAGSRVSAPAPKSLLASIGGAVLVGVQVFVTAVRARQQYKQTVVALTKLDDRTLADIGLRRDEIPAVAARKSLEDEGAAAGLWPRDDEARRTDSRKAA